MYVNYAYNMHLLMHTRILCMYTSFITYINLCTTRMHGDHTLSYSTSQKTHISGLVPIYVFCICDELLHFMNSFFVKRQLATGAIFV